MLAVFPLNIVVLPEESVALHLFEPRYQELFADHKNGKEFVILFSEKGELVEYGTTVFIEQIINEYPDGTVDLIVKGKQVVKIEKYSKQFPNKLYSGVLVNPMELIPSVTPRLREEYQNYCLSTDKKKFDPEECLSTYCIANRLKLSVENKNEFLSIKDSSKANLFLINEIRFLIKIREQEFDLDHKFHLN